MRTKNYEEEIIYAKSSEDKKFIYQLQKEAWNLSEEDIIQEEIINKLIEEKNIQIIKLNNEYKGFILGFKSGETEFNKELLKMKNNPGHFITAIKEQINKNESIYYTHMMAIKEESRGQKLGEKLKKASEKNALSKKCNITSWTWDPLLAINSKLNIHKLGVKISNLDQFVEDYYGTNVSGNYKAIPTDRFIALKYLNQENKKIELKEITEYNTITKIKSVNELEILTKYNLCLNSEQTFLEIPKDYNNMKSNKITNEELQKIKYNWRIGVREILKNYLSKGYAITDFISSKNEKQYYVLEK